MKRANVTLDEELDGMAPPPGPLGITPARRGSGKRGISLHHDRYFARHE